MTTVLIDDGGGNRQIIVKGAPEDVLKYCAGVPAAARVTLDAQFDAGARVVAVARCPAPAVESLKGADLGLDYGRTLTGANRCDG